jgi:hypothetical protein
VVSSQWLVGKGNGSIIMSELCVIGMQLMIMIDLFFHHQFISLPGQPFSVLKKADEVKYNMGYTNKSEHDLQIGFVWWMLPSIVKVIH